MTAFPFHIKLNIKHLAFFALFIDNDVLKGAGGC